MIEQLLKLFTEEPEKLQKAFIKCLHLFNSLLFSFHLYNHFIANFELIDIKNYSALIEFFISGRALVSLFVFSISYYLLDFLVSSVISILTFCFNKLLKGIKVNDGEIQRILIQFDVVAYNKEENQHFKGKNFDLVYQILRELNQESTIAEIREFISFKYKSIFVSSALIYFFVLPDELRNHYLNWIIPSIAVLIILIEILIEKVFEYMIKNRSSFNVGFDFIMINQIIYETLNSLRIVENPIKSLNSNLGFIFNLNSSSYRIMYIPNGVLQNQEIIDQILYFIEKAHSQIILIKEELYENIKSNADIANIKENLVIFDSGDNLKEKLYEYIYSINGNKGVQYQSE